VFVTSVPSASKAAQQVVCGSSEWCVFHAQRERTGGRAVNISSPLPVTTLEEWFHHVHDEDAITTPQSTLMFEGAMHCMSMTAKFTERMEDLFLTYSISHLNQRTCKVQYGTKTTDGRELTR